MTLISRMSPLIVVAILMSSCTYFAKKECEQMNWYQIGYDAALRGERASNDEKANRCRKIEADISESQLDVGFKAGVRQYCHPEGAFQIGKKGDLFNWDFCDTSNGPALRKKHEEGLFAYCQDGQSAGLSGKKYNGVCPASSEKTFLPDYRKGRKKYLQGTLQIAQDQLRQNDSQSDRVYSEKLMVETRLSAMPLKRPEVMDSYQGEREELNRRSNDLSMDLSQLKAERNKLQSQIEEIRKEIVTLE